MLIIYSKSSCINCDKAKYILNSKNIAFIEIKIDENNESREWLMAQGHRAVPQLYLNGNLFVEGGYQGLAKLTEDELFNRLGELNVSI